MQEMKIKNPCRYCADWKWHCRGMCIKKMAYIAIRRELDGNKGETTTTRPKAKI